MSHATASITCDILPSYDDISSCEIAGDHRFQSDEGYGDLYVDMEFERQFAYSPHDLPQLPQPYEIAIPRCYHNGASATVVQRDDDILTPKEIAENPEDVRAAIYTELQVRGLKDKQAHEVATFAANAPEAGQKIVTHFASQNKWPLLSLDID